MTYAQIKQNPELLAKERKRNRDKERIARANGKRRKPSTEAQRNYQRTFRSKNPERYAVQKTVVVAYNNGKIKKQPCEVCGSMISHAHHDDYRKPLDVRWFCRDHHWQYHVLQSEAKLKMPTTPLVHNGKHSTTAKPIQKEEENDEPPF